MIRSLGSLAPKFWLGAILLLEACSPTTSSSVETSAGNIETARVGGTASPATDLLDRMHDAPDTTAFFGTRTVVMHRDGETFEFIEDVGADGTGAFAVEVPSVQRTPSSLDPIVARLSCSSAVRSPTARAIRGSPTSQRSSSTGAWRSPRAPSSSPVTTAGASRCGGAKRSAWTPCATSSTSSRAPASSLAWRESNSAGQLLSSVEYTSFDFGADVSHMTLVGRAFPVTALDPSAGLPGQIGASVLEPDLAPPGFALEAVELIEPEPGKEWMKFIYTDGFERAYFLHRVDRSGRAAAAVREPRRPRALRSLDLRHRRGRGLRTSWRAARCRRCTSVT